MKDWITRRKLKKLQKKIDKLFDNLQCDEIFYIKQSGKLYAITWNRIFAHIDEITEEKEERIALIKEYREVKSRIISN